MLARERGGGCAPRPAQVFGATPPLAAAITAHLEQGRSGHILHVVPDQDQVEPRRAALEFFLGNHPPSDDPLAPPAVMALPAAEISPYAEVQTDRRTAMARLALLYRLAHDLAPPVLVASAAALFRRVIPPGPFTRLCGTVEVGRMLDRQALVRDLLRGGFVRAPLVDDPGTFAVRGAVVDVFSPVYRHPVRIELDGDQVESLRLFDAASQRTLRPIERLVFHPVRETVATEGANPRPRILEAADRAAYPSSKTRSLLEHIEAGEEFFGIESLAPAFHARMGSIFEYLPATTMLVVENPGATLEQSRRELVRLRESAKHRWEDHRLALDAHEFLLDEDEAKRALDERPRIELHTVEIEPAGSSDEASALRVHCG